MSLNNHTYSDAYFQSILSMNSKLSRFEKYIVAPSPSRNYYGLKILDDQVILYIWKISHGPHLSPFTRVTKFSDFADNKLLKDEITYAFGSHILKYIEDLSLRGIVTLLTLPKKVIEKLIRYLSLADIVNLFRVSRLSYEIFNSNAIWEILYKRIKRTSKLMEVEKELGKSQGFNKLAKSHHLRIMIKKSSKDPNEKSARLQKTTDRSERITRSASVNLPEALVPNDANKIPRKQSVDSSFALKAPKLQKSSKLAREKVLEASKKISILDEKSLPHPDTFGAGESYQHPLIINEGHAKNKHKNKAVKSKTEDESREEQGFAIQKDYLKSLILKSEIDNNESEGQTIKNRALTMRSPKSIFTKHTATTPITLGKLKSKSSDDNKVIEKKKSRSSKKDKVSSSRRLDLKNYLSYDDKNDDSDESGMSFLMKRYLEANDEVKQKLVNCERVAHSTRDSNIQVDLIEKTDTRKPSKKLFKSVAAVTNRPTSRNVKSITNVFTKLKSFKKSSCS